jgi:hypothetical protein
MVFSAPEITAVSKPKRKPPRAAIKAIRTGYDSMLVGLLFKFSDKVYVMFPDYIHVSVNQVNKNLAICSRRRHVVHFIRSNSR